jgi:hypothetical protein
MNLRATDSDIAFEQLLQELPEPFAVFPNYIIGEYL